MKSFCKLILSIICCTSLTSHSQQGGAVVIYDNQSNSLSVRRDSDVEQDDSECPYCHRPFREPFSKNDKDGYGDSPRPPHDRSFVDPEYFRMLAQSQRPSPAQSGVHTPSRRFTQYIPRALRSGRSREVSGTQPPPDAEFVASEPDPSSGKGISSSAFSPGYFKQLFREERELGRGGNGVVLLVEHVLDGFSLGQFACKRIPVGNDHHWLEKVLVEVKLLTQVSHQNLVKYHWVWVEEYQPSTFGPRIPCVWILQQYCNAGDLHQYVIGPRDDQHSAASRKARYRRQSKSQMVPADTLQRRSRLTLEEIFSFFKDITSGLHHLHSKGYIHRDVKPSNCLLLTDQGRTRVLLSDFGEVQAAGTRRGNTGATGTISYCAPEVLTLVDGRFGDFTTKSDIFSLGMIVYFMCFGRLPYANASEDDEIEDREDLDLLRTEITDWRGFDDRTRPRQDLPERLYKYLQRLLSVDPNERPSTEEILASIKANSNLSDSISLNPGATASRVTPLDASPSGRTSGIVSSLVDEPQTIPAYSRKRPARSVDRPAAPMPPSQAQRQPHEAVLRKHSLSPPVRAASRSHSPRLMLPPPAPRVGDLLAGKSVRTAMSLALLRSGTLIVKITTLVTICSPAAPRPIVLYPLLFLAVLEVVALDLGATAATLSFALHMLLMWYFRQHSTMCEALILPRPANLNQVL